MGNLMREYWVPAMLSTEVPSPDSDPVRVLLLGEQLIGFRDSNGKPGLIQNNCPHRGAKVAAAGNCIDMPNEPAESDFKQKVKATAYPCQERGGIVWTYMGSRQD